MSQSSKLRHSSVKSDHLLRFLLVNAIWGGALGLAFVGAVLALDIGHIRALMLASSEGWTALMLLSAGCVVTFASVGMAGAIMLLPGDGTGNGGHKAKLNVLIPAFVRSAARLRHNARR